MQCFESASVLVRVNNARFCQHCAGLPEKCLCDVCGKLVCQYCSQRAYWLISDPFFYSLLNFTDLTRSIHMYDIEYYDDVYFTCSYICEEKLFKAILSNKLDHNHRYVR